MANDLEDKLNQLILSTRPMSNNIEDRRIGFGENNRVRNAFQESLTNPNPTIPQGSDVILGPVDDALPSIISAIMKNYRR